LSSIRDDKYRKACSDLVAFLLDHDLTPSELDSAKISMSKEHGLSKVIANVDLLSLTSGDVRRKLLPLLKRKPVRTISGVAIVSVMTKPYPCPQDEPCAYCPGGVRSNTPQSYTGHEPAALRGIQNNYDPLLQVDTRLSQLRSMGHAVNKVELIVMGGTFMNFPSRYRVRFIKRCFDALNGFESPSIATAKKAAEEAQIRNVGLTVETRPDFCKRKHVNSMLSYGVTRVELGVQTLHQDILDLVGRKHSVEDVAESFQIAKDSGLKIVAHMMPGLPGSNNERDLESFRTLFEDQRFKPDMLKIYPCLVIKGTKIFELWRAGKYNPLTTEEAAEFTAQVKEIVPPWIRIMRIERDIPTNLIEAGVKNSNLRQIVREKLIEEGKRCRCIRCREVGLRRLMDGVIPDLENLTLMRSNYEASDGTEIFLSIEDMAKGVLIGFLRLRMPSGKAHRKEVNGCRTSSIRELHVCGEVVPIGKRYSRAWQHRGFGEALISEAEKISREEYDKEKILITSAVGTKQYYRKLGYSDDGPYVSKFLRPATLLDSG
jgi:elongator complex protein 3